MGLYEQRCWGIARNNSAQSSGFLLSLIRDVWPKDYKGKHEGNNIDLSTYSNANWILVITEKNS